jgi:phosphoglycerate kinase
MGLNKKTVDDINVKGKRVLVRCDFNVPLKDGVITDETRIVAALPTIKKLINDGGKVILCSHLGKVKNGPNEGESLAPVAVRLSEKLGKEVKFVADYNVTGEAATKAVAEMKDGDVVLLQNTRFRKEETKNVEEFSKELASLCDNDVYVNDAFGTSHRAHCSTVGVASFVKESAVGYLMQKEIDYLGNAVNNPVRPFVAILGGAKVSDKINVINNLLEKVDTLIIGGGMAYTFFKALGYNIGKSLLEEDKMEYALEMIKKAEEKGVKFLLPIDTVVAKDFGAGKPHHTVERPLDDPSKPFISDDEEGFDIGEKTRALYAEALKDAKTVVWNGPMGVFEIPDYAEGTKAVAEALANIDATTIIGGGDSAAAVNQMGYGDKMSHISTGGGASLEFLERKALPGVEAVQDK